MFFKRKPDENSGCPGSSMRTWNPEENNAAKGDESSEKQSGSSGRSSLAQWPVQLMLVPPTAPYFQDSDLVVVADCVPFAHGDFHDKFLKGRPIVVGCPKLDDLKFYVEKLTEIFRANKIRSVEVLLMEVPCCGGLAQATKEAKEQAESDFPLKVTTIGVRGENFGTVEL